MATSLASRLAARLRARADELASEWLAALGARGPAPPGGAGPEEAVRSRAAELVRRVAAAVAGADLRADPLVAREVAELARLRRARGARAAELARDLGELGRVVLAAAAEEATAAGGEPRPREVLAIAARLQAALAVLAEVGMRAEPRAGRANGDERREEIATLGRSVAHEVRNRTHAALLALEEARARLAAGRGDEAERALEEVAQALRRLAEATEDAFAVGSGGRSGGVGRLAPLPRICRRVLAVTAELAEHADVLVGVAGRIPAVLVDAARVELALVNLVGNAIKYADPARSSRWVEVRAARAGGRVRVTVRDNGVGVPPGLEERIFEYGFRADPGGGRAGEGIGLAVARAAAEQIGGRLFLEPRRGVGAGFVLDVPDAGDA